MRADDSHVAPFSWWSWRPGIKPLYALLLGGVALLPGLALTASGLLTLISNERHAASALLLIALGLAILYYPLLLTRWGLRDVLIARYSPQLLCRLTTRIIATREVAGMTRRDRPGMMPRGTHAWHGIAVQLPGEMAAHHVLTFSVDASLFSAVREGAQVNIVYSPHIHYVYSLETIDEQA